MRIRVVIAAGRNSRQSVDIIGVGSTQRTYWHRRSGTAQIRFNVSRLRRGRAGLALFQRPLLLGGVNDAEVVDARIGLRGLTSFHEVRNRDGRQEADDGHDDHDFHQRETRLAVGLGHFHCICFLCFNAAELRSRRVR